jgi:serine/threonine protein kinase
MSPPIIPKQLTSRVNEQGFIIDPQAVEETFSHLNRGATHFDDYSLIKTANAIYVASNVLLGKGSFGRVGIVQLIKHIGRPEYPLGTFMALKIFFDEDNYYNATNSFQLQQIPYDTVEIDGSYVTIRPLAYGENLLQVLFEDKHGAKRSLEFAEQFNIAQALLDEYHNRFEVRNFVHCALKPHNIIWDSEAKKAIIIDEEDVHKASFSTKEYSAIRHTPMYRPPEIETMPFSPAGDRYSIGIILAEIFLPTGTLRYRDHILNYINSVVTEGQNETLIQEVVKQVCKRLISEEPRLRPSLGLVKTLFIELKALNNTQNPSQRAVLEFLHDKYDYFSLYVICELLSFYKEETIVPDTQTLELQTQRIINTALTQNKTDEELLYELARHLNMTHQQKQLHPWVSSVNLFLLDENRPVPKETLQFIAKFLKTVNKATMLYKYKMLNFVNNLRAKYGSDMIPLDVEIKFIIHFTANTEQYNYIAKLDELMKDALLQAKTFKALGKAYAYIAMRFTTDPSSCLSFLPFIDEHSEFLKRKILIMYLEDLSGVLDPNMFIRIIISVNNRNYYNSASREEFDQIIYGVYDFLNYESSSSCNSQRKYNTLFLYNTAIGVQAILPDSPIKNATEAAELLIQQYQLKY